MSMEAEQVARALATLPASPWIMSSWYETTRTGVLVRRVMQCADEPLCVCVSVRKGSRIDPLIRDSRAFALSLMPSADRLLLKKFDTPEATDDDPFDAYVVKRLKTGAPVMSRAVAAFDCEVLSHVDMEADSELFVGRVVAVSLGDDQGPT
jgi:flavin reductase (DIM6/NTAB) family NADH-FMN oxidoreductase RutF